MRRACLVFGIVGLFMVLAACVSCREATKPSSDELSPSADGPLQEGATAGLSSSERDKLRQNTAGKASSGTQVSSKPAAESTEPEEEDPLAGMPPEMLKQLAEAEAAAEGEEMAGACITCHVDQVDEYVGSLHQTEKVTCADCHGSSEPHIEDENNDVKPDVLFFRANTDRRCGECHEDDCTRPPEYKPPIVMKSQPTICTDCHGRHDVKLVK